MGSMRLSTVGIMMLALSMMAAFVFGVEVVSVTTCESVSGDNLIPINIRESFTTSTPEVHAIVKLNGVKTGSIIKGVFVSIDAIATPNYEIAASESECYRDGEATAHFSLTRPDNGWPAGNYKIDVYVDGQLTTIKTFAITAAGGTPPPAAPAQPPPQTAQKPQTATPPPSQPAQSGYGYTGTYKLVTQDATLTLQLNHNPNGQLTGSLTSTAGVQFQVEGVVEEGAGYGACSNDQGGVYFETYLDNDQLYFSLIEPDENNMPDYNRVQELLFTREGGGAAPRPASPPSQTPSYNQPSTTPQTPAYTPPPAQPQTGGTGGAGQTAGAGSAAADDGGRAGKVYRHPIGFSFWYPSTWTLTEQDGYLMMTPPNAGKNADGATEVYLLAGEDVAAEGISSPEDQRVIDYLDQQMKSLTPVLQYKGKTGTANTSQGPGVVFEWEGTGPNGKVLLARSMVGIIRNHAIGITGIGFKELVEQRDKDMRQMFGSFGIGEGQNDAALIGTWELVSTCAMQNNSVWETDWSRAQMVNEQKSTLTFHPDGSWTRENSHHMLVGSSGIWLEDKGSKTFRGRWNAGDGALYMVWEDSSYDDFKYAIQGRELKLVTSKRGEIWSRK